MKPLRLRGELLLLFALGGCGGKGSARLEGNWKGIRVEGVAPAQQAAADGYALATSFEFKGESMVLKSPKTTVTARYRVEKDEKDTVVIVSDKDGTSDPQTFSFSDAKTFRWTPIASHTIVFAKQ